MWCGRGVFVGAWLLLSLSVLPALSGAVFAEVLFQGYPAVHVVRYPVFGDTLQALQASMRAHGPVDLHHQRRDGYTHWHVRWWWNSTADGSPQFETSKVALSVTVTLPDWRDRGKASPELQAAWDGYFRALVAHERQHIEIVYREFPEIERVLRSLAATERRATAQQAHLVGETLLRKIRALDAELDVRTNHGVNEGVCLVGPCIVAAPPQLQRSSNGEQKRTSLPVPRSDMPRREAVENAG